MKICISTWGNPEAWRYAGYVSDEGAAARGFSTLNLLVEGMGCDKIYIIVLNTLVSLQGLNSYDDVERRVAEYVENYLCLKPEHRNRVEIVVAPGTMKKQVGNFNEHFSTDLRNTRLKILTELYLRVINVVSGLQRQKVEVLHDVTHGINYLPVIASEAVEELAASISASLGEPVELEIYNADPFPGIEDQRLRGRLARSKHNLCHPVEDLGDHEIPMLTYSRLTRISIRPWHITGFMSYEESVGKLVSDVRECELSGNEVRSLVEVVRRISAAYRVGAVVELIKLIEGNRDIDDRIYKTLLQVVRCWQRNARIEVRERFIELTTKKLLDGIRLLIHAHSIVTGAKSTLEELETGTEAGVRLSNVKKLKDRLLGGSIIASSLVDYEISKLKNRVLSNEFKLYRDILQQRTDEVERKDLCSQGEPSEEDIRNFIAHAGFHTHVIEARRVDGGDIEIRLRGNCSNVLDKILAKIANRYSIASS